MVICWRKHIPNSSLNIHVNLTKWLEKVSSILPSSTSKYQVLFNFKVSSTSKYQVLEILHQVPSTSTLLDPNPDTYINGFVQEWCNSSALAMESRLSCTNPSIYEEGFSQTGVIAFLSQKTSLGRHFMSPRGPKTLLYLKRQRHYNMEGLGFGLVGPLLRIVWVPRGPRLQFSGRIPV